MASRQMFDIIDKDIEIGYTSCGWRCIQHFKRTKSEKPKKAVNKSVIAQKCHPCVCSQKKVHPHWEHYYHKHRTLIAFIRIGKYQCQRIRYDKTYHRRDRRKPY